MIIYDEEGHPHRRFWPHLLALALTALGFALLRQPPGAVAQALLDPASLLLAGLAGWYILKHRQLLPSLCLLGLLLGYGITAANFDSLGQSAPPELVALRLLACLATGYASSALRLLLMPPAPKL